MRRKHVFQSCVCSLQPPWASCSGLGCSVCFSWLPFHEEGTKTTTFKSAVSMKSTPEGSDEVTLHYWRKSGQKVKQRKNLKVVAERMRGHFIRLALHAMLGLLSYSTQNNQPRGGSTLIDLDPPRQLLIKKLPYRLDYRKISCRYFLNWESLSQMTLACVRLDAKLAGWDNASEKGFLFFTGQKETQTHIQRCKSTIC